MSEYKYDDRELLDGRDVTSYLFLLNYYYLLD